MARKKSKQSDLGCIGSLIYLILLIPFFPFVVIYYIIKAIFNSNSDGKRNVKDTIKQSQIKKQINYNVHEELLKIDNMEGHKFEYWCADLLKENDFYNVSVTRGSGDDGGDVVAYKDGKKYLFQCKRYSSNVGNSAVKDAFYGKRMYHADVAIAMTNRSFTESAIRGSKETGVLLWGRNKIVELLENRRWYLYEDENLWPHNRTTDKINYDYFASLPPVPKYGGMKEYIKCFPLGGETERWNPYIYFEQEGHEYSDLLLVEFYTEDFDSKEEAEHFFKAIEKRYYAIMPRGIHGSRKFSFEAYIHGNLIKDKFDPESCCWTLENWA